MNSFDLSLFNFIHAAAGISGFTDGLIIFGAKYLPYLLVIGAFVLLARNKNKREQFYEFVQLALTVILSRALITEIIRFFYNRMRPFEELGFLPLIFHPIGSAFPSGHAAAYFGLAFAILFYYARQSKFSRQNIGWWYVGAAVFMGVCRIAAGVHWPLDIIAGIVIAFISAWGVDWILKKQFNPKN